MCVCVCVKQHVSFKVKQATLQISNDWTEFEVQMPWPDPLKINFHLNVVSLSSYGLNS